MTDADDVLSAVEGHLEQAFGPSSGRAGVSFVGADRVEVLRFGPDGSGLVRYATLGMSRTPMADPTADVIPDDGPRAELVLSVQGGQDSVLRTLAVLGAAPVVEGVVVTAGAGLDLGQPLWEGGRFTAVLVGAPGGLVPDLPIGAGAEPVRFLPLLPMTPNEAAWKRVHGAEALEALWLNQAIDLRDPARAEAVLA